MLRGVGGGGGGGRWFEVNNFWLLNGTYEDPAGQLAWLEGTLAGAESAGERVLLLVGGRGPRGNHMCAYRGIVFVPIGQCGE